MRKTIYILCLLLAFGAGATIAALALRSANVKPSDQSTEDSRQAEGNLPPAPAGFALKPANHDFGKLFEGEARVAELEIERPGNSALRLGRLYSSSPCVRVEAAPMIVEAGKPAKVKVQVHSLTLEGKKSFPVYAEIIEPTKCVLRADVTVEVERVPAKLLLSPETFHFGAAKPGKTATVKIVNLAKYPLTVQELSSSLDGSSIEMKGPKTLAPGEGRELVLKLSSTELPPGPLRGEVTIKLDSPLHALVRMPVDGTVAQ